MAFSTSLWGFPVNSSIFSEVIRWRSVFIKLFIYILIWRHTLVPVSLIQKYRIQFLWGEVSTVSKKENINFYYYILYIIHIIYNNKFCFGSWMKCRWENCILYYCIKRLRQLVSMMHYPHAPSCQLLGVNAQINWRKWFDRLKLLRSRSATMRIEIVLRTNESLLLSLSPEIEEARERLTTAPAQLKIKGFDYKEITRFALQIF